MGLSNKIYDNIDRMNVVVFASGSGTNFREAVIESRQEGNNFDIGLLVTDKSLKKGSDKPIGAINYAKEFDIPIETLNGFRECGSWKEAQQTTQGMQSYQSKVNVFNTKLLGIVQKYEREKERMFDLAVLAGYMRLFRGPLLRRFNGTALNVHPADLSILVNGSDRKYIGENAVYDALAAGETRTRSSVILVDPETDAGAILTSGPWINYAGTTITQQIADEHQEKQKAASDWPALRFTLKEVALGNFEIHKGKFHPDGNPVVLYKGREMPYEGLVMQ